MKTVYQIILIAGIVVLSYLLYESILTPIRFEKEKKIRYNETIQRLKDIRTAEVAFKDRYGRYCGNFDSLINFIKKDSFKIEKLIDLGWDQDLLTRDEAIKRGKLKIEYVYVPIKDSLFRKNYPIDSMQYIPFTNGKKFELGVGEIETGSKLKVKVFEAKAHNNDILNGLDKQLIINLNDEREKLNQYPGLKVGSLEEATNNAGNWE